LNEIVASGNVGSQGAILNFAPGVLTLKNSTLSGNSASYYGGGLENAGGGTVTIIGSTISGNSASVFGGGVINGAGPMTIVNSTIANNTAGYKGGGLFAEGATALINVTIAGNSSSWGGGVYSFVLTLKNSILADNHAFAQGGNCILENPIVSAGHNVSDDGTCALSGMGDSNNVAAGLAAAGLQDNGGPTQTIALVTASPALNGVPVAPTNYCTLADGTTPIVTDARGVYRPQGSACDVGAYEAYAGDDDSAYALLAGGNTFNGNQTVNGTVSATAFTGDGSALIGVSKITAVTAGAGLTGGGSTGNVSLAVDSTVARTNTSNTFNGNQTINGAVTIAGGTPIAGHLSATSYLFFSPLKPGACFVAGFNIAGASEGDTVALGVPHSLMQAAGTPVYTAWIAAPDTVQIRACNMNPNVTQKAGVGGTIRVDVWKH
jgi:hypothetical protein